MLSIRYLADYAVELRTDNISVENEWYFLGQKEYQEVCDCIYDI